MNIKGSIRLRIFYGFLVVALLSIVGVAGISYILLKRKAEQDNQKELRNTIETLTSSLNYAVSHTEVTEENVAVALENKILEISDITKNDIVIYNLDGQFLIDNKNLKTIAPKEVPQDILRKILKDKKQIDITKTHITSSYFLLENHLLEPVAIVYFPHYHNNILQWEDFYHYIFMMILAVIGIIAFGILVSWLISKHLTQSVQYLSNAIAKINLNEKQTPIPHHCDDEFSILIDSYNKMLHLIEKQKTLLSHKEKESAWREMAKQVAHEVRNPLTPMKLLVQNFERKFDPTAPNIEERVKKLCSDLVGQIDTISKVANAFSEFTQLPERNDEIINVNQEIGSIIRVLDEENHISTQSNKEEIFINFDRTFFHRILTNIILNSQQAKADERELRININTELLNKKLHINIKDNGIGMSREQRDKIFEFSFIAQNSGSGLGLTLVKRMVEEYEGHITVFSKEGVGTEVSVILPINLEKDRNSEMK